MRIPGGAATSGAQPVLPTKLAPQQSYPQRPTAQRRSQPPEDPLAGLPTGPGPASGPTYPAVSPAARNPYSTPMAQGGFVHRATTTTNPVRIPAICLIVLACIHIAFLVFELIRDIIRLASGAELLPGNELAAQMEPMAAFLIRLVFYAIFFVTMSFVVYGSICALNLRSRGMALTAMIIAVIPCCGSPCAFFGIPFGIWGIIAIDKATSANLFR
jgi:hypothetical protein